MSLLFFLRMSLLFGLKGEGAWRRCCACKGVARKHLRAGGEILQRRRTAGMPYGRSCRMSLLFGLKGEGAWVMLCLQGGRQKTPTGRR